MWISEGTRGSSRKKYIKNTEKNQKVGDMDISRNEGYFRKKNI